MRKFKKHIAVALSMMMLCATVLPSVAYANGLSEANPAIENARTKVSKDIVYVNVDGKMIPVEVIETIHYSGNSRMSPMSFAPMAKVGEKRSYTIRVSNDMMGVPGNVGTGLSFVAKRKAAQIVGKAIAAKLGASFIPGLNFVSWALSIGAFANAVSGKSGIEITVGLKYTKTYLHKEGHYIEGWSPTSLSVRRY